MHAPTAQCAAVVLWVQIALKPLKHIAHIGKAFRFQGSSRIH